MRLRRCWSGRSIIFTARRSGWRSELWIDGQRFRYWNESGKQFLAPFKLNQPQEKRSEVGFGFSQRKPVRLVIPNEKYLSTGIQYDVLSKILFLRKAYYHYLLRYGPYVGTYGPGMILKNVPGVMVRDRRATHHPSHSQQLASIPSALCDSNTTSFRQRCTGRMFAAAGSRYYYIRLCSDRVNCTKTKLGSGFLLGS